MNPRSLFTLFFLLVLVSPFALTQCNTNDNSAPCFASVSDILGGRQSVIQDDDLLVAGAMNLHETRVEFQFDAAGHLAAVQTSQRDLVCPHRVCGADQFSQPWIPVAAQGD